VPKLGFPVGLKLDVWSFCDFASGFCYFCVVFCALNILKFVFINNGPGFFLFLFLFFSVGEMEK
jgi:hypothetical protein